MLAIDSERTSINDTTVRHQTARRHATARLLALQVLAALSLGLVPYPISAIAQDHQHDHHHHHAIPSEQDGYVRTMASYSIPDVKLLDANGAGVSLRSELDDKPVILNFIFTSCGAICPVMSTTFSQVQMALGPERDTVHMVSISIDPEHDTPAALKSYAEKYGAGSQWQMLTGSLDNSIAVQRAFDVYRGDKMGHTPATFLRVKAGQPWVRLDGFASAADILREYRQLTTN
ncbi:MAG TPA: SCO family protein [Thiobacillus sp.]|nr:SCO family protein [Thiobacillus sp.]